MTLHRILVPTNLHEPSTAAIRCGVALAGQFGARLFLLHVLPEDEFSAAVEAGRVVEQLAPELPTAVDATPESILKTVARADLRRMLTAEDERVAQVEYLLRPAGTIGPHGVIAECAREIRADLIIMGKHDLGRVEHLLGGSVAERVINHPLPCPLLIVPQTRSAG